MGWEKIATLSFLSWQAQWQGYASELRANLSSPALVISIVTQATMQVRVTLSASIINSLIRMAFITLQYGLRAGKPRNYRKRHAAAPVGAGCV